MFKKIKLLQIVGILLVGIVISIFASKSIFFVPMSIDCVAKTANDIQEQSYSANGSGSKTNSGVQRVFSFNIKKATYIKCASRGVYFQYEVRGRDAEGNPMVFYRSYAPYGNQKNIEEENRCRIENGLANGRREWIRLENGDWYREGYISHSTFEYSFEGTCWYQDGLIENPTSTYKARRF